jgi:ribonucleoside-diphosphate reductase alpha chain
MMLGLTYGNDRSLTVAAETMQLMCHTAYRASVALAAEKGVFPFFERDKYLRGPFIRALPEEIQKAIGEAGMASQRNSRSPTMRLHFGARSSEWQMAYQMLLSRRAICR